MQMESLHSTPVLRRRTSSNQVTARVTVRRPQPHNKDAVLPRSPTHYGNSGSRLSTRLSDDDDDDDEGDNHDVNNNDDNADDDDEDNDVSGSGGARRRSRQAVAQKIRFVLTDKDDARSSRQHDDARDALQASSGGESPAHRVCDDGPVEAFLQAWADQSDGGEMIPLLGDFIRAVESLTVKWIPSAHKKAFSPEELLEKFHLTLGTDGTLAFAHRNTHREGPNALAFAFDSEMKALAILEAHVQCDDLTLPIANSFQYDLRACRSTLDTVQYVVANAHRLLEHYVTIQHTAIDVANPDAELPSKRRFPSSASGLLSQEARRRNILLAPREKTQRAIDFVLTECARLQLARTGDRLFVQVKVHSTQVPQRDENGELVCANPHCGMPESHHVRLGMDCPCAFSPVIIADRSSRLVGTFAWEPLERNSYIRDFVRSVTNSSNGGAHGDAAERIDRLVAYISNCIDEPRLPVIDMHASISKHGHCVSFLNGVWFTLEGRFRTYQEMHTAENSKKYSDLVSHMRKGLYFFETEYIDQIMGPPDLSARTANFREESLRRKHVHPNQCCTVCRQTQRYHAPSRCPLLAHVQPAFTLELCWECGGDELSCKCTDFVPYYVDVRDAVGRVTSAPSIRRILYTQIGDRDDADESFFWYCAVTGRWYCENHHDRWGSMLFLWGEAGSGKSELQETDEANIPPHMFFAMNAKAEKVFGRQGLFSGPNGEIQKFIIVKECSGDSELAGHELKEMATGGSQTFAKKYGDPIGAVYKRMVRFDGNEPPPLKDLTGEFPRRTVVFKFEHDVPRKDGLLKERVSKYEAPAFLFLQGMSYAFARRLFGSTDLNNADPYLEPRRRLRSSTSSSSSSLSSANAAGAHGHKKHFILPRTLLEMKEKYAVALNPMQAFLNELPTHGFLQDNRKGLRDGQRLALPLSDFSKAFLSFRRANFGKVYNKGNFDIKTFATALKKRGMHVQFCTRMVDGKMKTMDFVVGVGRADDPDAEDIQAGANSDNDNDEDNDGGGGDDDTGNAQHAWRELLASVHKFGALNADQLAALCRASNTQLTRAFVVDTMRQLAETCSV